MNTTAKLRLAVDIGGTFTDVAVAGETGEIIATTKTPTTPGNPTEGALTGARRVLGDLGARFADVAGFIHGTTLATNALIERRGARVASITTVGFRDILEIAYERRYSQYDIDIEKPDLIVPRSRCFTVPERVSVRGEVLSPLDETAIDRLTGEIGASGAEAVAVCLLHSYANPAHEQRLRDLIAARLPGLFVSLSSEISPEAREFERLCTTIANACIQPLMATYLARFAEAFAAEGLNCPILMMTSSGGMMTVETARRLPIRLVESGPSGGAVLAARVAQRAGLDRVLSFDMGGTTAKLCLIDSHRPQTARNFEISRAARFIKGSGMPVRIPVVEMIEIGAGGGSIAGVDSLGRLTVGPKSAGAEPGPAAFGRGGTEATVTDADVTLGYIDPAAFAEGRLSIDTGAAAGALEASVGRSLGLCAGAAALGVSQIVDESMASAGRMHAVESGKDLADRVMIAFGGNGPLHATRVARRAGVRVILIPRDPGVGSAVGFLDAPVSFETVRSRYTTLDELDIAGLNAFFAAMIVEAEAVVRAGAPEGALETSRTAFMRYSGQGHEIEIALPNRDLMPGDRAHLTRLFETAYRGQFSRAVPGMEIEILNWAVRVSTVTPPVTRLAPVTSRRAARPATHRTVSCDETGAAVNAAIYDRGALHPGDTLAGPALIVEPQTTTLVSAGFHASVDVGLNIVLTRENAKEATP
jgi:N-methylhydantoinase A